MRNKKTEINTVFYCHYCGKIKSTSKRVSIKNEEYYLIWLGCNSCFSRIEENLMLVLKNNNKEINIVRGN
jgi:transcription elongation factor Elf1